MPRIVLKSFFNFITDKISNICKKRVQNLYIIISQKDIYYVYSEVINNAAISIDRKWTAKWRLKKMENIVGPDAFDCIYLVSTDICNTIHDLLNRIERDLYTKYVFFVFCDSHRLQFLIKDIIETN